MLAFLPLAFLAACSKTPAPETAADTTPATADAPVPEPDLEPEPEPEPPRDPATLTVNAWPASASVVITPASGEPVTGTATLTGEFVGPVQVDVTLDGFDRETHTVELASDESLSVYLEQEGQLLDRVSIVDTCNQPKALRFGANSIDLWMACMAPPVHTMARNALTGEFVHEDVPSDTPVAEITMTTDGTRAYTSQLEVKTTREIDTETGEVLRTFKRMGLWPKYMTLSADESKLYVSAWLVGTLPETNFPQVTEVDLATGTVSRRLETVTTPRGLYATGDGKYLYVAGFDKGQLDRIDLESGEHEVLFSGGVNLRHVVGDDARGRIYVSDLGRGVVFLHDVKTGETRELVEVDANTNTIALSPDKQLLFISSRGADGDKGYLTTGDQYGSYTVADALTGKRLDVVVGGNQPTGLSVSPDGKYVAFSNFRDHDAHVFRIPPADELRAGGGGRTETYSLLKADNPNLPDALKDPVEGGH